MLFSGVLFTNLFPLSVFQGSSNSYDILLQQNMNTKTLPNVRSIIQATSLSCSIVTGSTFLMIHLENQMMMCLSSRTPP